jgi:hypothetical protein
MLSRTSSRAAASLAGALLLGVPAPAGAACFNLVGCVEEDRFRPDELWRLSCRQLRDVRVVLKQRLGLCASAERPEQTSAVWGACAVAMPALDALPETPRHNLAILRWMETRRRCPVD